MKAVCNGYFVRTLFECISLLLVSVAILFSFCSIFLVLKIARIWGTDSTYPAKYLLFILPLVYLTYLYYHQKW